ncbi:MAG: hypothetical protein ABR507_04700 [Actinomycetota bacterium]|nr:hypothetical protein [Actinomycetota bacterium]
MGFKTGLVVGLGIGYVKGAKAGYERYETIKRNWNKLQSTEAYQRFSRKAEAAIGLGVERGKAMAMDRFNQATTKMKHPVGAARSVNGDPDYSR